MDDAEELTPGNEFRDGDETTLYWLRDGKVMYRHYPLTGAHAESFRFYRGSFGKDRKSCWSTNVKLTGGNGATFRALNYAYVTDGVTVWTTGGRADDADAATFVVCDSGSKTIIGTRVSQGFGKDSERVYSYDGQGKTKLVRKASAATFTSVNGIFGHDGTTVFYGATPLPNADATQWRMLGGNYSRDDKRIYYCSRPMVDVDIDSFEIVPTGKDYVQLARDAKSFWNNDTAMDAAEFQKMVKQHT